MNGAPPSEDNIRIRSGGTKRPFLIPAILFSAGIFASHTLRPPLRCALVVCAVSIMLAILVRRRTRSSHMALYSAMFFLGMAWYQHAPLYAGAATPDRVLPRDHIARRLPDGPVTVILKGAVSNAPLAGRTAYGRERTNFLLKVSAVRDGPGWSYAQGLVDTTIYTSVPLAIEFGDEVLLEGLISKPAGLKNPGLFDYTQYLEIKDIYAVLKVREGALVEITGAAPASPVKKAAYALRRSIRRSIDRHLEGSYGSFLKAIMIGDRAALGESLKEDFIKTGTVHILAISGLQVSLIAALVIGLFALAGVRRKTTLAICVVFLAVYTFAAGASPPIVRSMIVFSVFALGYIAGRQPEPLNSLAVAAILMLIWEPKELFDPSFQLTFASIAGMIVFTPKLNGVFGLRTIGRASAVSKLKAYAITCASVSVAAWLGTWPFVAAYFNIVSPISIAANLLVVPLVFLLTVITAVFLAADAVSALCAAVVAQGAVCTEKALFAINHLFAEAPFSCFRVPAPPGAVVVAYYALIALWVCPPKMAFGPYAIRRRTVAMALLVLFNCAAWSTVADAGRSGLKVAFLDVGQGDCAVIELPRRGCVVVDAGTGGVDGEIDTGRAVLAPYLWNRNIASIDAVIMTHGHADHIGGIPYILKNFNVGCVIDNGSLQQPGALNDAISAAVRAKDIRRISVGDGDLIGPMQGVSMFVLNPEKGKSGSDPNTESVVIKLVYEDLDILFGADVRGLSIARMTERYGKFLSADIHKVPHHGGYIGREDVVNNYFSTVDADISIISVGKGNRYRAPSKIIMDGVTLTGSTCYKTMDSGAVMIMKRPDRFLTIDCVRKN